MHRLGADAGTAAVGDHFGREGVVAEAADGAGPQSAPEAGKEHPGQGEPGGDLRHLPEQGEVAAVEAQDGAAVPSAQAREDVAAGAAVGRLADVEVDALAAGAEGLAEVADDEVNLPALRGGQPASEQRGAGFHAAGLYADGRIEEGIDVAAE